jgi:transcriptional regulator with XRE-family HTH domain
MSTSKQHDGPLLSVRVTPADSGGAGWRWEVEMSAADHSGTKKLGYRANGALAELGTDFIIEVHDSDRPVWTGMPASHRQDIRKVITCLVESAAAALKVMKQAWIQSETNMVILDRSMPDGRAALGWEVRELAAAAKVSIDTVARFEAGEALKERTIEALRPTLDLTGIEFIPENGGGPGARLKSRPAANAGESKPAPRTKTVRPHRLSARLADRYRSVTADTNSRRMPMLILPSHPRYRPDSGTPSQSSAGTCPVTFLVRQCA